jgi:hypothetical protein
MALEAFRARCRELLAEGVKPTATEFAKRGWPNVTVANNRLYAAQGRPACPVPGSGTCFTSGRYNTARREELLAAGWVFVPNNGRYEGAGVWVKP